jgi:hypothetical protein
LLALLRVFPAEERSLRQIFKPVLDSDIDEALANLSEAQRENFTQAMLRMNPVKPGDHRRKASSFKVFDLRVYHGTGNDESRPKLAPVGSIYTTDGRIMAAGDPDQAALLKVPVSMECYVITFFEGNTFWPPREDSGVARPEGTEEIGGAPICRSVDTEVGNRYGSCGACAYRPFINNKPNRDACSSQLTAIVVPRDFSGIYRLNFSGTNGKPGRMMRKKTDAGWTLLWQHPFAIGTKKEVAKDDPNKRWFVMEPSALTSVRPTPAEEAFLLLLCRRYDTEVFWPERYHIHYEAAKAPPAAPSGEANLAGLLSKGAAPGASAQPTGAAPAPTDKSKNNL